MPRTDVYFYQGEDGGVPALEWLNEVRSRYVRAFKECFGLIALLEEFGYELRRSRADFLRDGVQELRTEIGNVNYRLLYGFVGKDIAVLTGGLTKEKTMPSADIDRAVERIAKYKQNPDRHRYVDVEDQNDATDE